MSDEILYIETEVTDKNFGRVHIYIETDNEIKGPVPARPRPFGSYFVVYRGLWDTLIGRSIEDVLDRAAKKYRKDWQKRKEQKANRKTYQFNS